MSHSFISFLDVRGTVGVGKHRKIGPNISFTHRTGRYLFTLTKLRAHLLFLCRVITVLSRSLWARTFASWLQTIVGLIARGKQIIKQRCCGLLENVIFVVVSTSAARRKCFFLEHIYLAAADSSENNPLNQWKNVGKSCGMEMKKKPAKEHILFALQGSVTLPILRIGNNFPSQ